MIGSDLRANHDVRVLSEVSQVQRRSEDSSDICVKGCVKEVEKHKHNQSPLRKRSEETCRSDRCIDLPDYTMLFSSFMGLYDFVSKIQPILLLPALVTQLDDEEGTARAQDLLALPFGVPSSLFILRLESLWLLEGAIGPGPPQFRRLYLGSVWSSSVFLLCRYC
jgi:hypothetical protein